VLGVVYKLTEPLGAEESAMALIMLGVSVIVARSKTVLLNNLKHSSPRIKKVSGIVLAIVGLFLVYVTIDLQFFVQTFFPK